MRRYAAGMPAVVFWDGWGLGGSAHPGAFVACCLWRDVMAQGRTVEEAADRLDGTIRDYLLLARFHGEELPGPALAVYVDVWRRAARAFG